jgi:transcriptional regulator of acetoin/glycerol metabolism
MDPLQLKPAQIVSAASLKEHREKTERLTSLARNGLETLFHQVVGQNYVLLLADPQGIAVDFFGDPSFENELKSSGLSLGADWSENIMGTSGVGACIATGQPVTIHQTDHFNISHTPLSCTAAPILDMTGNLLAVLDLSLLRPPSSKATQNLALKLVKSSVRRIEMANLTANCQTEWIVSFSEMPERVDLDPSAAIALDQSGRIVGLTGTAMRTLLAATTYGESAAELIGRSISDFFKVTVNKLPELTRSVPVGKRLVQMTNGRSFFVYVTAPRSSFSQARTEMQTLPRRLVSLGYEDVVMRDVVTTAARVAKVRAPILIKGETGVGKQTLASAIHESRSSNKPFVVVNCASFKEQFLDTGQSNNVSDFAEGSGYPIDRAAGGTLFLDEICDLTLESQAQLVGALKINSARTSPKSMQMRILSSTSYNIEAKVESGAFRSDLFFLLTATSLTVPPLRKRSDFDALLTRLLKQRSISYPKSYQLSSAARMELRYRQWPGNIRELINVLDIALTATDTAIIDLEHLPSPVLSVATHTEKVGSLAELADDLETHLRICGWNIARTARRLGVNRSTIHRRMERLGLSRPF